MSDDLRMMQLLCSRLCHDLVGPVSAINNGIELIEDAPDMMADSLGLLETSAQQASRRLAFYRVAFGFGGGDGTGALNDVRLVALDFIAGGHITLDWPVNMGIEHAMPKNAVKLLMNLILLGTGTLIRGGDLKVRIDAEEGGIGIRVAAQGQGAMLQDDIRTAMTADFPVADLSAHTVQSHFTARLAQSVGGDVAVTENGDEVTFTAVVKAE